MGSDWRPWLERFDSMLRSYYIERDESAPLMEFWKVAFQRDPGRARLGAWHIERHHAYLQHVMRKTSLLGYPVHTLRSEVIRVRRLMETLHHQRRSLDDLTDDEFAFEIAKSVANVRHDDVEELAKQDIKVYLRAMGGLGVEPTAVQSIAKRDRVLDRLQEEARRSIGDIAPHLRGYGPDSLNNFNHRVFRMINHLSDDRRQAGFETVRVRTRRGTEERRVPSYLRYMANLVKPSQLNHVSLSPLELFGVMEIKATERTEQTNDIYPRQRHHLGEVVNDLVRHLDPEIMQERALGLRELWEASELPPPTEYTILASEYKDEHDLAERELPKYGIQLILGSGRQDQYYKNNVGIHELSNAVRRAATSAQRKEIGEPQLALTAQSVIDLSVITNQAAFAELAHLGAYHADIVTPSMISSKVMDALAYIEYPESNSLNTEGVRRLKGRLHVLDTYFYRHAGLLGGNAAQRAAYGKDYPLQVDDTVLTIVITEANASDMMQHDPMDWRTTSGRLPRITDAAR